MPEYFIPIRFAELVELVGREPGLKDGEREGIDRLCRIVAAVFHFEAHERLMALKAAYAPLDPDADTFTLTPLAEGERERRVGTVFAGVSALAERANYRRLERSHIEAAIDAIGDWGVKLAVDFDVFERLEVYARGDALGQRSRRRWRKLWRSEQVGLPVFRRLVVVFRLRPNQQVGASADPGKVYLKLFKDIPHMDLEMLLPSTKVKMSLVDQGKIVLPTVSGIGLAAYKLVTATVLVAAVGTYGFLALLGFAGGTIGYGIRSYHGYQKTRQKYQLSLTQSLYFQNLANNSGVLFRLLDEAQEQECREAILAWFHLWRHAGEAGWTPESLDHHVQEYIHDRTELEVDFEISDALDKLIRLGLVDRLSDGNVRAVPLRDALDALCRTWGSLIGGSRPIEG